MGWAGERMDRSKAGEDMIFARWCDGGVDELDSRAYLYPRGEVAELKLWCMARYRSKKLLRA